MISGKASSSPWVDMGQGSFFSASSFSVLIELDAREERVGLKWEHGGRGVRNFVQPPIFPPLC